MTPSVLVVGAGPGGLALAQGLNRLGVAVRVVERERWRSDVVYGFRLRLRRRGIEALRALLPPELFAAFERTCGSAPAQSLLLDEHLQPLPPVLLPDDDVLSEISVSRITLQQILLAGLDGVVSSGKAFTRYEELPDGRVRAFFDDGSSQLADVLVGADGADSRVRRQLLPQARLADSGVQRIAGKIDLSSAASAGLAPWLRDKTVSVRSSAGWHLFVTKHHRRHRGLQPADAAFTGNDAAVDHRAGLLFDNTRDYVYWALGVPRALRPDAATLARGPQALLAWVQRLAAQGPNPWPAELQAMLALTDASTVNATPVLSAWPVAPWPTSSVTLLGDAIHSMTYFRALGANAALVDARLLQQALADVQQQGLPLQQSLARYEQAMLQHGFAAVQDSVESLRRNVGGVDELKHWPAQRHEPLLPEPAALARVEHAPGPGPIEAEAGRALFFHDPASLPLLEQIERVARSDATVLLLGETGVGKDLVARHLHQRSGRGGPFVSVNGASLGGALRQGDGRLDGRGDVHSPVPHIAAGLEPTPTGMATLFESARGGTLFLDEVGDIPQPLQLRLLSLLQQRQAVGAGAGTPNEPDVRVIAVTHVDLATAVQAGRFRADLYYRLHVAALRLPPLRERRGDILPLARHFAETYRRRLDGPPVSFSAQAETALREHAWPGNIRELENRVHYAVIVSHGGRIGPQELKLDTARAGQGTATLDQLAQLLRDLLSQDRPAWFEDIERTVLSTAFEACGANQLRTAQKLGLSRHVLRARLLHHGLVTPRAASRPPNREPDGEPGRESDRHSGHAGRHQEEGASTSGRNPPD